MIEAFDLRTLWHRWFRFVPVRTVSGSWAIGPVWQRLRRDGVWEYKRYVKPEETMDEYLDRQY